MTVTNCQSGISYLILKQGPDRSQTGTKQGENYHISPIWPLFNPSLILIYLKGILRQCN
jgi:hypothetical protein